MNKLMELLFHKECPVCGRVINRQSEVCSDCLLPFSGIVASNYPDRCDRCGKTKYSCICFEHSVINKLIFPLFYSGVALNIAVAIKEDEEASCLDFAVSNMILELKSQLSKDEISSIDYITFVPTTDSKLNTRGFNPSGRLAYQVAKLLSKPVISPPIIRLENSLNQHELTADERIKNAESAYQYTGDKIAGSILLIDDIVTTGSTINRCSEILLEAGASQVTVLATFGTVKQS